MWIFLLTFTNMYWTYQCKTNIRVFVFDTKIFFSGTKEEIPCDHFLVTMSLLRLLLHSDVWGKRNSFLVGEVGGVGRLPISFGRDPSVFWAAAQTRGPARASPERGLCPSLLALVQVSRAASGRRGHWEVFLTHPWVASGLYFSCVAHISSVGVGRSVKGSELFVQEVGSIAGFVELVSQWAHPALFQEPDSSIGWDGDTLASADNPSHACTSCYLTTSISAHGSRVGFLRFVVVFFFLQTLISPSWLLVQIDRKPEKNQGQSRSCFITVCLKQRTHSQGHCEWDKDGMCGSGASSGGRVMKSTESCEGQAHI